MVFKNGFIINPSKELTAEYKLSPFSRSDIAVNRNLPQSDIIGEFFNHRFGPGRWIYTYSGREAIGLALKHLKLVSDDFVTIFTSSGNRYVSKCVTEEVEKICKWSRKMEPLTKAILVIHEFGIPFNEVGSLRRYGLPIIEDCAYSFFSSDIKNETGNIGEYIIYSFPKMFPIQAGGMFVSKTEIKVSSTIEKPFSNYLRNVLSNYILKRDLISKSRIRNYEYLKERLKALSFEERFILEPGTVPGVFMFKTGGEIHDLHKLKIYLNNSGIECSVFYGEESFFIPVHQNLTEDDLLFFYEVVKHYKSKDNDNI